MALEAQDLPVQDLQILFNMMAAEHTEVMIEAPLMDLELLRYDPYAGKITRGVKGAQYRHSHRSAAHDDKLLLAEMPEWASMQDALQSSGYVDYDNEAHLADVVRRREAQALVTERPKLGYLAFDTNMLYQRWPAREVDQYLGGRPKHLRYVISDGVRSELDAQVRYKFDTETVENVRRRIGHDALVKQMRGRAMRRNRRAANALGEYEYVLHHRRGTRALCDPTDTDREENDRRIAASYADFEERNRCNVMLVTSDRDMATHAANRDLESLLVEYARPDAVPTGAIDEAVACRLIHAMAVHHMVLRIQPMDFYVWSDWHPKNRSDWAHEKIRVAHAPANKHARTFFRRVVACQKVVQAERDARGDVPLYAPRARDAPPPPVVSSPNEDALAKIQPLDMTQVRDLRREWDAATLKMIMKVQVPPEHAQTDECTHDALLAVYAFRTQEYAASAAFRESALGMLTEGPGADWVRTLVAEAAEATADTTAAA